MEITTNNHWHEFKTVEEVPSNILSDYEHLLEDGEMPFDGWIHYKDRWYHISDFLTTEHFPGWHGYHSDSFFSGVLIALSACGESYKIGMYYS
jgi:hypothetical protein